MSLITTDTPPRRLNAREVFNRSDTTDNLPLPDAGRFHELAGDLERALQEESQDGIQIACTGIVRHLSSFYKIGSPFVRIHGVRPRDFIREKYGSAVVELYGDYHLTKARIRIWMRTAVRKQPVRYRTLLNTLLHEFCHHLDIVHFNFGDSPHTRGFFDRISRLYFQALGEEWQKPVWKPASRGRYYLDFGAMRKKKSSPA